VYAHNNDSITSTFDSYFIKNSAIHSQNTRSLSNLHGCFARGPGLIFVPHQLKFKVLNSGTLFHKKFVIPPSYIHSKQELKYTFCINAVVYLKFLIIMILQAFLVFMICLLYIPTL